MWTGEAFRRYLDALRDSAGFRNYQTVKDRVLRMNDAARASGREREASQYWEEELLNFEYMLDASPLVIDRLRHHCHHITGLRVYDYRSNRHEFQRKMAAKLAALRKRGGADLLVPEPPLLGGFGFEIEGGLFNIDTLKFYEVLIALERGSVLNEFRGTSSRKTVWEVGAGWGGFPYQFKSICPNTTYVITDFSELFLFSATYLMTAFPEARVWFFGDTSIEALWADWQSYDFVFFPNTELEAVTPPQLDLTINMVSFQEMTTEQVRGYVRHAAARRCLFLYSLNRDRSPYNTQLTSVADIIAERYWPHDIDVLPVNYLKMLDQVALKSERDYRHIIGWRRVES
jgi:hypothetical protein